ncbi:MAG TPA: CvpA family protein [Rhodospirillales bacterium]|nr:CvpA family protein [Rhodospirillales bacterium]
MDNALPDPATVKAVASTLNATDGAIALVLLVSALLAFARGFIHEVLAIAGWLGAIFASIYGFPYLKPYARQWIPYEMVADIGAGVVIFILTLVLLSLLTRGVSQRIHASALNALDRSLGFLFGLARGVVLVCLVYVAVEWVIPIEEQPKWLAQARSMPLVRAGGGLLKTLIPAGTIATGETAAAAAGQTARKFLDVQDAMGEMIRLQPRSPKTDKGADRGYGKKERTDMQRLIEGNN